MPWGSHEALEGLKVVDLPRVLGAACHVPHGHTSSVMLPSVLRWNLSANAERTRGVTQGMTP